MKFLQFAALLIVAGPVVAQDARPAAKPKDDKKVCRRTEVTGSYLGAKRECHSKAEWERRAEQARDAFSRRRTGGLRADDQ